ncbi:MAG: 7-carboxy-7-deazaguanine synthase [Smithella sp.]
MSYFVKEIFYSIQGEGFYTGRPAVFCRFAGCNLWSGKEADRDKAICKFCDTDFVGCDGEEGGEFKAAVDLADRIAKLWPQKNVNAVRPFAVFTGGEPLLQMDAGLISALQDKGFEIAVETNGTILPPAGVDWICVSPKANAQPVLRSGNELKLVFPQEGAAPEEYAMLDFQYFFLQPMDSPDSEKNATFALEYVKSHPQWRLSLQMHKILKIK